MNSNITIDATKFAVKKTLRSENDTRPQISTFLSARALLDQLSGVLIQELSCHCSSYLGHIFFLPEGEEH